MTENPKSERVTLEPRGASRGLIVMPAFNEEETLGSLLTDLGEKCPDFDCLVVNDGSTDDTAAAACRLGARVLSLPFNTGYGCALKAGLTFADRRGYDMVVLLDADGQHDPCSIADLTGPIVEDKADVVLGNRYGRETDRLRLSWLQRLGHGYLQTLLRILTGRRVCDPTSGFQAISRRALWFYVCEEFPDDYPDANVLLMLHRAGIRFMEVPAVFHPRETGESMHGGLLRPVLYLIRATLAIAMVLLRPRPCPATSNVEDRGAE